MSVEIAKSVCVKSVFTFGLGRKMTLLKVQELCFCIILQTTTRNK